MTDLTESLRNPSRFTDVFQNMDDAADEIESLTEERDALKADNEGWLKSCETLLAQRNALDKAARLALDALEYHTAQTRPIERTQIAIEILKAAL